MYILHVIMSHMTCPNKDLKTKRLGKYWILSPPNTTVCLYHSVNTLYPSAHISGAGHAVFCADTDISL